MHMSLLSVHLQHLGHKVCAYERFSQAIRVKMQPCDDIR